MNNLVSVTYNRQQDILDHHTLYWNYYILLIFWWFLLLYLLLFFYYNVYGCFCSSWKNVTLSTKVQQLPNYISDLRHCQVYWTDKTEYFNFFLIFAIAVTSSYLDSTTRYCFTSLCLFPIKTNAMLMFDWKKRRVFISFFQLFVCFYFSFAWLITIDWIEN